MLATFGDLHIGRALGKRIDALGELFIYVVRSLGEDGSLLRGAARKSAILGNSSVPIKRSTSGMPFASCFL